MKWTTMKTKTPPEGFTAVVASNNEGHISYGVGTYCDGEWYKLWYDKTLGVLRRLPFGGKVEAYSPILIPEYVFNNENE